MWANRLLVYACQGGPGSNSYAEVVCRLIGRQHHCHSLVLKLQLGYVMAPWTGALVLVLGEYIAHASACQCRSSSTTTHHICGLQSLLQLIFDLVCRHHAAGYWLLPSERTQAPQP